MGCSLFLRRYPRSKVKRRKPSVRHVCQVGVIGGVSVAAARRKERELDRFPHGLEGRISAQVGILPAEGRPLFLLRSNRES